MMEFRAFIRAIERHVKNLDLPPCQCMVCKIKRPLLGFEKRRIKAQCKGRV